MKFPKILLISLLATAPFAGAALISYEGFDYSSGAQSGLAGGVGWAGAWTDGGGADCTLNLASTGLTQGALTPSGLSLANTGAIAFRTLGTTAAASVASASSANGEIWISVVAGQPSGTYGGITLWNAGSTDLSDDAGNYNLVLGRNDYDGGNWSWTDTSSVGNGAGSGVTAATQVLYVMRLGFESGRTSVGFYLFTGANPGAAPQLSEATYSNIASVIEDSSGNRPVFDRIRVSGGGMNLDEIRIGTSFADVVPTAVPESGTYGLMGAGALAAVALVRRRRKAA